MDASEEDPPPRIQPPRIEASGGFSLASMMMFVTLLSVVLGVGTIAPGLGVPLGIVAFFAWFRTATGIRRRAAHGMSIGPLDKVRMFLASFGVLATMIVLVFVSGCAVFCAACFAIIAPMEPGGGFAAGAIIAGIVAAAGIMTTTKFKRVSRRYWQRELGEDEIATVDAPPPIPERDQPLK